MKDFHVDYAVIIRLVHSDRAETNEYLGAKTFHLG